MPDPHLPHNSDIYVEKLKVNSKGQHQAFPISLRDHPLCDLRLEAILDWKQAENVIPNIGRRTTESQTLLKGKKSRISIKLGDSTREAFDADFFSSSFISLSKYRLCFVSLPCFYC